MVLPIVDAHAALAGPRVSTRFYQLLMSMLRLPGGCIAFVPISPDVMKITFDAWFGLAGLLRYLVLWGDHPRWSRRRFQVS